VQEASRRHQPQRRWTRRLLRRPGRPSPGDIDASLRALADRALRTEGARMSAGIPRLAASAPSEDIVEDLLEHGAVIVEGVLSPDLLDRFNAEIDPILEQVSPDRSYLNPAIDYFYGDRVRQITGVAARSRVFGEEILCHPFYTDICDAIL